MLEERESSAYKINAFDSKGKKVGVATCNAYPPGILNDVKFDKTSTYLQRGNVVVMFSDGVSELGEEWIEEEILKNRRSNAQAIADKIASKAALLTKDTHQDDITVLVAILCEKF